MFCYNNAQTLFHNVIKGFYSTSWMKCEAKSRLDLIFSRLVPHITQTQEPQSLEKKGSWQKVLVELFFAVHRYLMNKSGVYLMCSHVITFPSLLHMFYFKELRYIYVRKNIKSGTMFLFEKVLLKYDSY